MHVHRAVERSRFAAVERFHQLIAREDAAGGAHQLLEQVELDGSEIDALATALHLARARVEGDAVDLNTAALRPRLGAPQDRPDARAQFAGVEWLGDIIVSAHFESDDAVHIVAAGGEHHHREFARLAEAPQDLEAVQAGEHNVEHYQVVRAVQCLLESRGAVVSKLCLEAFALEEFLEQQGQLSVVVDDEDTHPLANVTSRLRSGQATIYKHLRQTQTRFTLSRHAVFRRFKEPMNIKKTIATAAIAVGLATAGFAAQDGPRGRAFGHHRGDMLTRAGAALDLTDTQKEFAKQLAADTRKQAAPVMKELRQNRQEIAAAVKSNNTAAITTLSQRQGDLTAQLSALHAKSMASFYAQLTPEQKAKADEMHSRVKDRVKNRGNKSRQQ